MKLIVITGASDGFDAETVRAPLTVVTVPKDKAKPH